jgi:hypothetical protein
MTEQHHLDPKNFTKRIRILCYEERRRFYVTIAYFTGFIQEGMTGLGYLCIQWQM